MDIAQFIDHTLLKPDATESNITKLCEEAKKYHFASCCVNPCWVSLVSKVLTGSGIKTCSVVGFPLGASHTMVKYSEAERCVEDGAEEIDMVMNIGAFKSGNIDFVKNETEEIVRKTGLLVKVIIETCLLSTNEKVEAAKVVMEAGAHFVKTSTGFSKYGATIEDVKLLKGVVGERIGVKASGGIRTYQQAKDMIEAGATRIGTSAGVAIVTDVNKNTPGGS
ncbi:MAG: deoxyribose-phosphate aldolase [bacterium (Candidatus Stahlbacteria) CG08_land_8_20_14_0_20_40_26]|nr:MAG: deoxyribose-phosphate aldolase [bacterium (Candidatus Stahlbacteria) CG23_combo_of_CG06-09_8_20_14_all_40_9]PIS24722.1 MAG: deoxyribose-phosphate aldolase [bacterium (Candidatus Stahlbacteria) CG08_land_8_20_14_0_20_40_26]